MKNLPMIGMAMFAGAALLAGCADQPTYQSQPYQSQPYQSQSYQSQNSYTGTVDRIEVINRSDSSNVAGTIIGGIIGGVIGHQIGSGNGNTAATVVGAAGGAYAGNQVQQWRRADHETFRVTVRISGGSYQTITTDNITDLRTGDRVRVEGNSISRY